MEAKIEKRLVKSNGSAFLLFLLPSTDRQPRKQPSIDTSQSGRDKCVDIPSTSSEMPRQLIDSAGGPIRSHISLKLGVIESQLVVVSVCLGFSHCQSSPD